MASENLNSVERQRKYGSGFCNPEQKDQHNGIWPKDAKIGKVFLVNNHYYRVDGINQIVIRSQVGNMRRMELTTPIGEVAIGRPLCEGYVFAPTPRWISDYDTAFAIQNRCMTGQELIEAEKNHYFVAPTENMTDGPKTFWMEYNHEKKSLGETESSLKLLAFNRALHRFREETALKEGGYQYEDLMNRTYDPNQKL